MKTTNPMRFPIGPVSRREVMKAYEPQVYRPKLPPTPTIDAIEQHELPLHMGGQGRGNYDPPAKKIDWRRGFENFVWLLIGAAVMVLIVLMVSR